MRPTRSFERRKMQILSWSYAPRWEVEVWKTQSLRTFLDWSPQDHWRHYIQRQWRAVRSLSRPHQARILPRSRRRTKHTTRKQRYTLCLLVVVALHHWPKARLLYVCKQNKGRDQIQRSKPCIRTRRPPRIRLIYNSSFVCLRHTVSKRVYK